MTVLFWDNIFIIKKENQVKDDSMTETYAALRLFVDNERWKDVPFYIRTGKKLNRRDGNCDYI